MGILVLYVCYPIWAVKHIPCPPYTLPGLGHLLLFYKLKEEVFVKLARAYGPIYRLHIGRQPYVVVADAELCRELCVKQFKSATDRNPPAYIQTVPVLNRGLFFTKGNKWSSLRNIQLPFYHSDQMRKYVPLINRVVENLVNELDTKTEGEDVELCDYLMRMTVDVIGEAAFGIEFGCIKGEKSGEPESLESKLIHCAHRFIAALRLDESAPLSTIVGIFLPLLQQPVRTLMAMFPSTADGDQVMCAQNLQKVLSQIVDERKRQIGNENRIDGLSLLLNAKKNAPDLLTDDYVGGLTFEMLLTGSETTSTTLSFALYLISCHPEVERKLLEEIDAFGRDRKPTYDDLDRFPYVEQVLKEALRYYTPSPIIAREAVKDIELGGYRLKKGTAMWIAMNAVLWDPKHFPEPHKFKPERFDPNCEENKQRHPYAFSPFGMGPRICIGYKFSMQEAKMALILLYQKFTFEHSPAMEKPLALHFGIIRRPKYGVRLRVHRR